MGWCSVLTFKEFSDFCERCATEQSRQKRTRFLTRFLESCRQRMGDMGGGEGEGDSLYPVMRLMLPHLDKARGAYR